jgi:5'-nucleotidase
VAELEFIDYEVALRETVPRLRDRDVDLLLVVSHVCIDELLPLIEATTDLGLDMVGAGHCNELEARLVNETVLLGGGYHFTAYARADFSVDITRQQRTAISYGTRGYTDSQSDPDITALINAWSTNIEASLSEVVAYNGEAVARGANSPLNQAIVDSWLWHDDSADIAITNAGGIRIDLPAGEIDLATLVAMMPFDNTIVAVTIPGAAVIEVLENGSRPVVAGVQRSNGQWLLTKTGQAIDADAHYRVLVNSFMYAGGDGYEVLKTADPSGFDTAIHYRQPFLEWLRSQQTSPDQPLSF